MTSRLMECYVAAVESVAILELLCRLTDTHFAEIRFEINLGAAHLAKLCSPHCDLHLIVGIINACVEGVYVPCLRYDSNVAVVEISMSQGRFDSPSIFFNGRSTKDTT